MAIEFEQSIPRHPTQRKSELTGFLDDVDVVGVLDQEGSVGIELVEVLPQRLDELAVDDVGAEAGVVSDVCARIPGLIGAIIVADT